MKLLIVNASDTDGGAARAASRLHKGLILSGIDSRVLVQRRLSDDHSVIGPESKFGMGMALIRPHIDRIPLALYSRRRKVLLSPAILPSHLTRHIAGLSPDIVHLHWINNGLVRVEALRQITQPILWTLHDMWPFTGICHYNQECERYRDFCGCCPLLGSSRKNDLSHSAWRRKSETWKKLNLTVVAPSSWMANCAASSSLLKEHRIEVIPNGIDTDQYRPIDRRLARDLLRLPQDRLFILFGAMSATSDTRKGFHVLQEALKQLSKTAVDRPELLIYGASAPVNPPDFGLKSHYLGYFHDDVSLSILNSAADVFVAPSLQENLSNTVLEAAACGIPCVAFRIGGMPDLIEHEQTGYLAAPGDFHDLARGIGWVLQHEERRQALSRTARLRVESKFALETVARRHIALYRDVLSSTEGQDEHHENP